MTAPTRARGAEDTGDGLLPPVCVTTALGESRYGWPEGWGFECPWCGYPVLVGEGLCRNPGCYSAPGLSAEGLMDRYHADALREAEEMERVWLGRMQRSSYGG